MTTRRAAPWVALLLTTGLGARALAASDAVGDPPRVRVTPIVGAGVGDSLSSLKARSPDPADDQALVDIRSDLVFPLDGLFVGLDLAWSPSGATTVSARLQRDGTGPAGRMTNSDFVDDRPYIYAESQAELANWQAAVDTRFAMRDRAGLRAGLLGAVDYQHIGASIVGYEGWQYSLFSDARVEISQTQAVLDYEVTYLSPRLGGFAQRALGEHLVVELGASVGLAFAWDQDDHLLRGRTSVGSGLGPGGAAWARADLHAPLRSAPWLSAHVAGGGRYLRAVGTTTQTFEDGAMYEAIPYTLRCRQAWLEVGLDLARVARAP